MAGFIDAVWQGKTRIDRQRSALTPIDYGWVCFWSGNHHRFSHADVDRKTGGRRREWVAERRLPSLARGPVRILFAPLVHGIENGLEALAEGRQGVFHFRRHLPVDLAANDAVRFHFS